MRAWVVMTLATLAIPLAFLSPFFGLLAYCWLSYMRPQEMAWGISHLNFGLWTGVALFAGLLVRLRLGFFRLSLVTVLLLLLWADWAFTTWTAIDRGPALQGLVQISKIFLICLVTTGLCDTRSRLRWVILAIVGSLAFHGAKMGVFGVLHPGARITQGIGGMMSGNNENAIAFGIALPFLVYLGVEEVRGWRRLAWFAAAFLTAGGIVFSYSRGGFLGLAAAVLVMVWRTRARLWALAFAVPALAGTFLALAPDAYLARVSGIRAAADTDLSVIHRLQAWGVAKSIALDRPWTGIGPRNFVDHFQQFPHPWDMPRMEIHNTYLEFAAASGIPALLLYLALVAAAWRECSRIQRDARTRADPRLSWHVSIARAIQASMTAFLVSSTFGSLMHFDLMYHLGALAAALGYVYRKEAAALAQPAVETASAASVARPALSRYDRSPPLPAGLPPGLPDFRARPAGRPRTPLRVAAVRPRRRPA